QPVMMALMAPAYARAGAESYGSPRDISSAPRLANPRPSGRKRCEFAPIFGVGYEALPTMISWPMIVSSTARLNESTSNSPSGFWNLRRFSDARLHAESSRYMYSEQGFDALMRAVPAEVCQSLMVVSNCSPGSPHCQAASAICRQSSRALYVCT